MRFTLFTFIFTALSVLATAQNKVNASLENVTVFTNGAELNHVAKVQLQSGNNEIIIGNLSNSVDENSIQIGCNTDVTIMSVSYRQEFLSENTHSAEYNRINDSLKKEKDKLQEISTQIDIYKNALTLLDANKIVGGANTGLNVSELQKAVDYYISKNKEIKIQVDLLNKQKSKQEEVVNKYQNQLNELSNDVAKSKGEIVVQLQSDRSNNATFGISYISYTANWSPVYDLKVNSTVEPLKLIYKGNITQWTGLDWKKVKLTLSTSNPSQSGVAPVLSTWFLNYYQPTYKAGKQMQVYSNSIQAYAAPSTAMADKKELRDMDGETGVDKFTDVTETAINASFEIDLPYDIAADGKSHSVAMKEYLLPAGYKYYCAPRKEKDVFLMAEISDWEKLNLLAGPANIIFDGTYIGKSYIDPNATQDTLNLSLGRDKKIIVKREKLNDFCSSKIIGSNKTQIITYEIKIKNTRKESVQLLLKDQFPKSMQDDIKIELLESSSASINDETNIMTWKLDIAPNETKKIKVSFSVKYPKDKQISLLF